MKKHLVMVIMLFIGMIKVSAQSDNPVLKDYKRIVFFSGNDSSVAYIPPHLGSVKSDGLELSAPWELQEDISAIPESVLPEITTKVKNKYFERYKVKNYDGYVLENQVYHSLNVRAQNAVGENWQFIKLVSTGKINLYNLYSSLDVASVTNDGLSEKFIWYAEHPSWIFYKENPKRNARYVSDIAAKRDLSDCQVVYDKFKNKEYENEKTSVKVMGIKQTDKLTIGLTVIKEYNSICK